MEENKQHNPEQPIDSRKKNQKRKQKISKQKPKYKYQNLQNVTKTLSRESL